MKRLVGIIDKATGYVFAGAVKRVRWASLSPGWGALPPACSGCVAVVWNFGTLELTFAVAAARRRTGRGRASSPHCAPAAAARAPRARASLACCAHHPSCAATLLLTPPLLPARRPRPRPARRAAAAPREWDDERIGRVQERYVREKGDDEFRAPDEEGGQQQEQGR